MIISLYDIVPNSLNLVFQEIVTYYFEEKYGKDWFEQQLLPYANRKSASSLDAKESEKYKAFVSKKGKLSAKSIDVSFACVILLFCKDYQFPLTSKQKEILHTGRRARNDISHFSDGSKEKKLSVFKNAYNAITDIINQFHNINFSDALKTNLTQIKEAIDNGVDYVEVSENKTNKIDNFAINPFFKEQFELAKSMEQSNFDEAIKIYDSLSLAGDVPSMCRLSDIYIDIDITSDTSDLKNHFEKICQLLTRAYDNGMKSIEEKKNFFENIIHTLNFPNAESTVLFLMGQFFEQGKMVSYDMTKAFHYYMESYKLQNVLAKNRIKNLFWNNLELPLAVQLRDIALEASGDLYDTEAGYRLCYYIMTLSLNEKSTNLSGFTTSKHLLESGISTNNEYAICYAIKFYDEYAVNDSDVNEYLNILRQGMELNVIEAYKYYAHLYEDGHLVEKDAEISFKAYEKGYQLGDIWCGYKCGTYYHHGYYVDDIEKANKLFLEAIEKEQLAGAKCYYYLNMLAYEDESLPFSSAEKEQSILWLKEAADTGHDLSEIQYGKYLYWEDRELEAIPYLQKTYNKQSFGEDDYWEVKHCIYWLALHYPQMKVDSIEEIYNFCHTDIDKRIGLHFCLQQYAYDKNNMELFIKVSKELYEYLCNNQNKFPSDSLPYFWGTNMQYCLYNAKEYEKAYFCYQKACDALEGCLDNEYANSLTCWLADLYTKTDFSNFSEEKALESYQQLYASDSMDNNALWNYANLLEKHNSGNYIDVYTKAADNGDVRSNYYLGVHYLDGPYNERDEHLAFQYMQKAGEHNYKDSKAYLGRMYIEGLGVMPDSQYGLALLSEIGETNSYAARLLGVYYKEGTSGIRKNEPLAKHWYTTSVNLKQSWYNTFWSTNALYYLDCDYSDIEKFYFFAIALAPASAQNEIEENIIANQKGDLSAVICDILNDNIPYSILYEYREFLPVDYFICYISKQKISLSEDFSTHIVLPEDLVSLMNRFIKYYDNSKDIKDNSYNPNAYYNGDDCYSDILIVSAIMTIHYINCNAIENAKQWFSIFSEYEKKRYYKYNLISYEYVIDNARPFNIRMFMKYCCEKLNLPLKQNLFNIQLGKPKLCRLAPCRGRRMQLGVYYNKD